MDKNTDTYSICPFCKSVVKAKIFQEDSKIYMIKECLEHGMLKSLICSDAEFYFTAEKYNHPGKKHLIKQYAASKKYGCPWDCGLCADHQQHTCVGLLEVTGKCDQNCPVCYASSDIAGEEPTLEELVDRLKFLSHCENENPSLVITGGEPTLRDDLVDLVSEAQRLGYINITLNSNGLILAKNPNLAYELAKAGVKEINLSFDSLNDDVYQFMRGSRLLSLKKQAVENAKHAGLKISLSVVVVKGVNDSQIGEILDFAKKVHIDGLIFTPIAYVGRLREDILDPLNRTTTPDIIKAIVEHTNGELYTSDFIPVPCPDSHCSVLTYAFNTGEHLIPLTRYCDVSQYLGTYGEKPKHQDPIVAAALDKLWSMSAMPGSKHVLDNIKYCCTSSANLIDDVMSIQVHSFQDPWTFDLKRCMKCCIHVVLNDKLVPFCIYNNLYR